MSAHLLLLVVDITWKQTENVENVISDTLHADKQSGMICLNTFQLFEVIFFSLNDS